MSICDDEDEVFGQVSMLDQVEAYELMDDDVYHWGDAYNSADHNDYNYALYNVQCPVHHTAICRCVDPALNSHIPVPGEYVRISITVTSPGAGETDFTRPS
jgi:hypothetical protein